MAKKRQQFSTKKLVKSARALVKDKKALRAMKRAEKMGTRNRRGEDQPTPPAEPAAEG